MAPSTQIPSNIGTISPVLFSSGDIGFQVVDENGKLTALINHNGAIFADPHGMGVQTWETTTLSPRHKSILLGKVASTQFDEFPLEITVPDSVKQDYESLYGKSF